MSARLYSFVFFAVLTGAVFLWFALQLPSGESVTTLIGPRTWPLAIVLAMLTFLALTFVLLVLRGPAQFIALDDDDVPPEDIAKDEAVLREDNNGYGWRYLAVFIVIIAYTIAMEFTGKLISTTIFAAVVTVILGERRPLRVLMTTGVAILVVEILFDRLLNIPLP